MSAWNINKIHIPNDPFLKYCATFPCGVFQYLEENEELQKKRVFNDYGWGGYFIWTLPDMKLFIDGRLPQVGFMGQTMLEEYKEFFVNEKSENKLNEHDIELVIINIAKRDIKLNWFEKYILLFNETSINNKNNPLKDFLEESPRWEEIYSDNIAGVYLRRNNN